MKKKTLFLSTLTLTFVLLKGVLIFSIATMFSVRAMAKDALVFAQDQYAVLIICTDADVVKVVFLNAIHAG